LTTDALYDSVDELSRFQQQLNTAAGDNPGAQPKAEEQPAQPYLQYRRSVDIGEQPLYAKPDKSRKVAVEDDVEVKGDRRSMPLIEQYSSFDRIEKQTAAENRHSVNNVLPDGLYSNLEVPPLPPPLALEHLPSEGQNVMNIDSVGAMEINQEIEEDIPMYCNVQQASRTLSVEQGNSNGAELPIENSFKQESLTEPPRERIGTIEASEDSEGAPMYCNVTLAPNVIGEQQVENGMAATEPIGQSLDDELAELQNMFGNM